MSGTRGGIGRLLAMVAGLAVALLLAVAAEARAGLYTVAQCGWYVGIDAEWADTTGGAKFRPDSYCVPGPPDDPFDGSHVKSLTRDGQGTVSGTRFARWRWSAPPYTGITQVRGTWWHALHDGIEQRVGGVDFAGGFTPFLSAATTETTPTEFVAGFAAPVGGIEDRLLCARAESKWCSLDAGSWSALRALTITLRDDIPPTAEIAGGDAAAPGWHRGTQSLAIAGMDSGAGIRLAETTIDGNRVAFSEYPCAMASIGGEWRGTQMRPCQLQVAVDQSVPTQTFSDGPHSLGVCHADFSGNVGCTPARTILIDNNPPADPRRVALAGGEGWRRSDDFDLAWTDPDQGPGSPIIGAGWRIAGSQGFDGGPQFSGGRDLSALSDLSVPGPGAYSLRLWLRDEAGNEAPAAAIEVPLRFDDVPPALAFSPGGDEAPPRLEARVEDPLSGPAAGTISYRRADADVWTELPTKLLAADDGSATLVAPAPDLRPGTYLFRAEATDAAGNPASTTLRADGTQMAIRVPEPVEPASAGTRLFARLGPVGRSRSPVASRRRGASLTVPFAARARLSGRLTTAAGAGIAGREVEVHARPSRGSLAPAATLSVTTGEHGGFELALPPGTSRRLGLSFPGAAGLDAAHRGPLELRVRSGVSLAAWPRALRTGETVRLRGRVRDRGAPVPRRGKLVAIQYREAETGRWRPVLVTRTDHDGRFDAGYRFRYVTGTARIELRATALAEERWPYAPGSSPPVTVTVAGR